MTRALFACLALLPLAVMAPGISRGQTIAGPSGPVAPHRMARVVVGEADSAVFDVTPLCDPSAEFEFHADEKTCLLVGSPGRYKVQAFVSREGRLSILSVQVVIQGDSAPAPPAPAPTPTPTPSPTPSPPPARTPLQKVAIEYAYAVPLAAKATAPRVAAGEFETVAEAMGAVETSRNVARQKLAAAIFDGMDGAFDPDTGAITDRAKVAKVFQDLGGLVP